MHQWKRLWYSLMGPLMIWVAAIIFGPILVSEAIIKTASFFCVAILAPLAAFAEIAPPFVTRMEVNWRNRNSDALFENDVAWEDVPFLPPALKRIRSTTPRRKRQKEKETETSIGTKPSIKCRYTLCAFVAGA